jgi:hypothetical protein
MEHLEQALVAIDYLDPEHPKKLMPRMRWKPRKFIFCGGFARKCCWLLSGRQQFQNGRIEDGE